MKWEILDNKLILVATDGSKLAMNGTEVYELLSKAPPIARRWDESLCRRRPDGVLAALLMPSAYEHGKWRWEIYSITGKPCRRCGYDSIESKLADTVQEAQAAADLALREAGWILEEDHP